MTPKNKYGLADLVDAVATLKEAENAASEHSRCSLCSAKNSLNIQEARARVVLTARWLVSDLAELGRSVDSAAELNEETVA